MANAPTSLTLRAYRVGFGDCFLLTFHYPGPPGDRHILIDFGTNKRPPGTPSNLLRLIAEDIRSECGGERGKLHAVVLTHRHKDHMLGFTTSDAGDGPGDVIASLKPDLVVQPWTEDPNARPGAKRPTGVARVPAHRQFAAALEHMHDVSAGVSAEGARLAASEPPGPGRERLAALHFLGEEGIKNPSAVKNLQAMGRRHEYVYHGYETRLSKLLPGVSVSVLGPPTLEQSDAIRKERSKDANEFWMFQARAGRFVAGLGPNAGGMLPALDDLGDADDETPVGAGERHASPRAGTAAGGRDGTGPRSTAGALFPGARTLDTERLPTYARWFVPRLRRIRADSLLHIVRVLDDAMNNTSVILLFEVNGRALLFPGDAQIENWSYTLDQPTWRERLRDVTLYKVGHHGSRNATPKTLWNGFRHRGPAGQRGRLVTVMSTLSDVYGKTESTRVPRETLVRALRRQTELHTTQSLRGRAIREDIAVPL